MHVFNKRISRHGCQKNIGQIQKEDRSDLLICPRCLFIYNYSASKLILSFFLYPETADLLRILQTVRLSELFRALKYASVHAQPAR